MRRDPVFEVRDSGGLWEGRWIAFRWLPSSNQWCVENAAGCRHGDMIWAREQSAGRGRLGRTWSTPGAGGLTFSVALRAPALLAIAPNLGQAAALAVCDAMQALGADCTLKWPNDVLAPGGKIAGILVESLGEPDSFVVGVGLNVNATALSFAAAGLSGIATSLQIETGRPRQRRAVLRRVLRAMQRRFDSLAGDGMPPLLDAWREADALAGRDIEVTTPDGPVSGRYAGLAEDGALCLALPDGGERRFWTGDVVRARPGGPPSRP